MTSLRPLSLLLILTFVATTARADWQSVAPGVDYQEFVQSNYDIHVVRVDLTRDEIRVISTRESERGLKVSDFAKKEKAIAAINADYFDAKFNPIGLTIGPCGQWEGTKDTAREGVLAIGDGKATIARQSEVMDPPEDWVETAVSGWPALVVKGDVIDPLPGSDKFTRAPHPRTAVATGNSGKLLYLIVADGRRTGVPGLTLPQLGFFIVNRLHATAAMNLDGGGSTALWLNDRIVNRPSDGVERPVGDHLAVVLRNDFIACDRTHTAPYVAAGSTSTKTISIGTKANSNAKSAGANTDTTGAHTSAGTSSTTTSATSTTSTTTVTTVTPATTTITTTVTTSAPPG